MLIAIIWISFALVVYGLALVIARLQHGKDTNTIETYLVVSGQWGCGVLIAVVLALSFYFMCRVA